MRHLLNLGVRGIVDLALNEPVPQLPRDILYCRFPLVDGAGNDPWMLVSAIDMVANLLKLQLPTLVFCSAGLSRAPAITAAALSSFSATAPEECLKRISSLVTHDVNPGFWNDVMSVCRARQNQTTLA